FSVTLNTIIMAAFVMVTGMYLAIRPSTYIQGLAKLLPKGARDRACEVLGAIGFTLHWWLIGQVTIMILVGIATATGLAILGIELALILGIIAGLLDFIPNV